MLKKYFSAIVLLSSNLLTMVLAIAFGWNIYILLWGYWTQSVIIGFFTFLKILFAKNAFEIEEVKVAGYSIGSTRKQFYTLGLKVFDAFFFAVHYGLFHVIYAMFLGFFSLASGSNVSQDLSSVLTISLIFFVNHLFSFLYYLKWQNKEQDIRLLVIFPYIRIIPMHFTIIFGGIFLATGFGTIIPMLIFMLLKTAADVIMHLVEHRDQFKAIQN